MLTVDVADLAAYEVESFESERRESDLHGPGVIEAVVGLEVDLETLGERFQPLNALRAFEECTGSCD